MEYSYRYSSFCVSYLLADVLKNLYQTTGALISFTMKKDPKKKKEKMSQTAFSKSIKS